MSGAAAEVLLAVCPLPVVDDAVAPTAVAITAPAATPARMPAPIARPRRRPGGCEGAGGGGYGDMLMGHSFRWSMGRFLSRRPTLRCSAENLRIRWQSGRAGCGGGAAVS